MGTAAAMQALKKFTSGGKEEGNGGKNDFVSLAMGEASKVRHFPVIRADMAVHLPSSS